MDGRLGDLVVDRRGPRRACAGLHRERVALDRDDDLAARSFSRMQLARSRPAARRSACPSRPSPPCTRRGRLTVSGSGLMTVSPLQPARPAARSVARSIEAMTDVRIIARLSFVLDATGSLTEWKVARSLDELANDLTSHHVLGRRRARRAKDRSDYTEPSRRAGPGGVANPVPRVGAPRIAARRRSRAPARSGPACSGRSSSARRARSCSRAWCASSVERNTSCKHGRAAAVAALGTAADDDP